MSTPVAYNRRSAGSSGGTVEDVAKRLGRVETDVSDLKAQVSAVLAVVPHLCTKADLSALEAAMIKWIVATMLAAVGLAFITAKFVH